MLHFKKFEMIKKYVFAIAILLACSTTAAFAQGPGPVDDDPDTAQAPIDGGVGLLIAAGVAYGAKKAKDSRNKKRKVETGL
jgi:hypothetical protein